jgi:Ni,Fe-hydrogenase maturation factor
MAICDDEGVMADVEPDSDHDEPAASPVRAGARKATAKMKATGKKAAERAEDAKTAATDVVRDAFDRVIDSIDELGRRDK